MCDCSRLKDLENERSEDLRTIGQSHMSTYQGAGTDQRRNNLTYFNSKICLTILTWCIMHDPRYVLRMFLKFGKSHPKCSYKLGSYTKKGITCNFFEYVLFELLPKKCKDILIT